MVRFYCDRCNTEVETPDDLTEIVVEGRERPNVSSWNWRGEMCRSCYDAVKESMGQLLGSPDDPKRKVRRAGA